MNKLGLIASAMLAGVVGLPLLLLLADGQKPPAPIAQEVLQCMFWTRAYVKVDTGNEPTIPETQQLCENPKQQEFWRCMTASPIPPNGCPRPSD